MRFQSLKQDIGWYFEDRITYEKNGQAETVLGAGHMEIGNQLESVVRRKDTYTLQLCISNICPIEERQKV